MKNGMLVWSYCSQENAVKGMLFAWGTAPNRDVHENRMGWWDSLSFYLFGYVSFICFSVGCILVLVAAHRPLVVLEWAQ